jgi:hypothetical protein
MRNGRLARICLSLFLVIPQIADAQEVSTPEERSQWVETTHKLEGAPFG